MLISKLLWRPMHSVATLNRKPSTSEILYGVVLKQLPNIPLYLSKSKEDEPGMFLSEALASIWKQYMSLERPSPFLYFQTKLYVNPENAKQNNLLKGSLLLPNQVSEDVRLVVFAKVMNMTSI